MRRVRAARAAVYDDSASRVPRHGSRDTDYDPCADIGHSTPTEYWSPERGCFVTVCVRCGQNPQFPPRSIRREQARAAVDANTRRLIRSRL